MRRREKVGEKANFSFFRVSENEDGWSFLCGGFDNRLDNRRLPRLLLHPHSRLPPHKGRQLHPSLIPLHGRLHSPRYLDRRGEAPRVQRASGGGGGRWEGRGEGDGEERAGGRPREAAAHSLVDSLVHSRELSHFLPPPRSSVQQRHLTLPFLSLHHHQSPQVKKKQSLPSQTTTGQPRGFPRVLKCSRGV